MRSVGARRVSAQDAASVEKIYRAFDLDYTPALAQKIRTYIAQNPADKHGGHSHRFADTLPRQ